MGKRRKGREVALQFLYQLDLHGAGDPAPHEDEFWGRHPVDRDTRTFAESLVRGTKQHQSKTDQLITQYAEHWDLDRMAVRLRVLAPEGGTIYRRAIVGYSIAGVFVLGGFVLYHFAA